MAFYGLLGWGNKGSRAFGTLQGRGGRRDRVPCAAPGRLRQPPADIPASIVFGVSDNTFSLQKCSSSLECPYPKKIRSSPPAFFRASSPAGAIVVRVSSAPPVSQAWAPRPAFDASSVSPLKPVTGGRGSRELRKSPASGPPGPRRAHHARSVRRAPVAAPGSTSVGLLPPSAGSGFCAKPGKSQKRGWSRESSRLKVRSSRRRGDLQTGDGAAAVAGDSAHANALSWSSAFSSPVCALRQLTVTQGPFALFVEPAAARSSVQSLDSRLSSTCESGRSHRRTRPSTTCNPAEHLELSTSEGRGKFRQATWLERPWTLWCSSETALETTAQAALRRSSFRHTAGLCALSTVGFAVLASLAGAVWAKHPSFHRQQ